MRRRVLLLVAVMTGSRTLPKLATPRQRGAVLAVILVGYLLILIDVSIGAAAARGDRPGTPPA
jgi:uncharacterized membrane protein